VQVHHLRDQAAADDADLQSHPFAAMTIFIGTAPGSGGGTSCTRMRPGRSVTAARASIMVRV
jgi:hypothetical protein